MSLLPVALSIALLGQADDKKASLEILQKRADTTRIVLRSDDKNKEQGEEATLVAKHNCRTVRFSVYVKDGKAALKATPVRD